MLATLRYEIWNMNSGFPDVLMAMHYKEIVIQTESRSLTIWVWAEEVLEEVSGFVR